MDYECCNCDTVEWFDADYEAEEAGWLLDGNTYYCPECRPGQTNTCEFCRRPIPENTQRVEVHFGPESRLARNARVCEVCKNSPVYRCQHCGVLNCPGELMQIYMGNTNRIQHWCIHCLRHTEGVQEPNYNDADPRRRSYMYNLADVSDTSNHILQMDLDPEYRRSCSLCEGDYDLCAACQKRAAEHKEAEETTLWVYDTMVKGYHSGEHDKFKRLKLREQHENPYLYYGMEIELLFNNGTDVHQIAKRFIEATNGMFVAEFDRSVTDMGIGFELISRPMSYKIWTSEQTRELLKRGFEAIEEFQPLSPQPDTCGIHVHMSKIFFEKNTEKKVGEIKADLDWIFQIFQPEIEKFAQRDYTQYCMSKAYKIKEAIKKNQDLSFLTGKISLKRAKSYSERNCSTLRHHDVVSMSSGRTVEVRAFKSTTSVDHIIAIIEFCRAVAHAARNLKLDKDTRLRDVIYAKDSTYLPKEIDKLKIDTEKKLNLPVEIEL